MVNRYFDINGTDYLNEQSHNVVNSTLEKLVLARKAQRPVIFINNSNCEKPDSKKERFNNSLIEEIAPLEDEFVKYAQKYYSSQKAKYLEADALDEKLVDKIGKFNSIVSFETIEHLQEDELFIKNLKSLLLDEGMLIISTPLGRGRKHPCSCPYHFFQYRLEEFDCLLKSYFSNVNIYLQVNNIIEKPKAGRKYYLAVAICSK